MNRTLILAGSFFGMVGIILGAFAAHGLAGILSPEELMTFETGVRYQIYHAFFLLILSALPGIPQKVKKICGYLTTLGIVLFSGSIYLLAINSLVSFDFRVIGWITPVGGILLIASWIRLFISGIKLKYK